MTIQYNHHKYSKSKYLPNTHEVPYKLRLLLNYSSTDNIPCCKIKLKKKILQIENEQKLLPHLVL